MPKAPATITAVKPPVVGGLMHAINNISAGLGVIVKAGRNDFHKYNYARMPDLMKAVSPLMQQHQVTCLQSETGINMIADGVLRVEFEFTFTHAPTGESHTLKASGMAKVSGDRGGFNDRAIQAIATTTKKYVLIGLFNVVVEDQPDVDNSISEAPKGIGSIKQQAAPLFNKLLKDLTDITNLGDLNLYGDDNGLMIATLPHDWQKALRIRYVEKLRSFKGEGPTITERAIKARNSLSLNDENPY